MKILDKFYEFFGVIDKSKNRNDIRRLVKNGLNETQQKFGLNDFIVLRYGGNDIVYYINNSIYPKIDFLEINNRRFLLTKEEEFEIIKMTRNRMDGRVV